MLPVLWQAMLACTLAALAARLQAGSDAAAGLAAAATLVAGALYSRASSERPPLARVAWILLLLAALSPMLASLTSTIGEDTVHTAAALALAASLAMHDYGPHQRRFPASLMTAVFAAVCLASRLESAWRAFCLVVFALVAFGLLPALRARSGPPAAPVAVTAVHVSVPAALLLWHGAYAAVTAMLAGALLFVTLMPAWFCRLHALKK